jgi:hypothetical protein
MEIRDVGGLAVEMVRRDRFRPELLVQRASEVLDLEQRLHELDSLLFTQVTARRELRGAPPCQCGAPLLPGAHFCSHCGRPTLVTPPLVTCAHCGRPLPADANFCSFCGNSAAGADLEAAGDDFAETIARPWAGEERAGDA